MSGIVALVAAGNAPIERRLVERMTRSMRFRGPDAQETWIGEQAGLGGVFRVGQEVYVDESGSGRSQGADELGSGEPPDVLPCAF